MRYINFFYLEKINYSDFKSEKQKWEEAGFEYVPYHFLINLTDFDSLKENINIDEVVSRGRPFNMNNGLIRDSFISQKGIGILIITNGETITTEMYNVIGSLIKNTYVDLGIENHQLVTNFYEKDKKVDTIKVTNAVKEAKDAFIKIRS